MMRGTSWLLALVVATARGEMCGDRARVAVVGGGPGGALTAILLARQERLDVTLIRACCYRRMASDRSADVPGH